MSRGESLKKCRNYGFFTVIAFLVEIFPLSIIYLPIWSIVVCGALFYLFIRQIVFLYQDARIEKFNLFFLIVMTLLGALLMAVGVVGDENNTLISIIFFFIGTLSLAWFFIFCLIVYRLGVLSKIKEFKVVFYGIIFYCLMMFFGDFYFFPYILNFLKLTIILFALGIIFLLGVFRLYREELRKLEVRTQ